MKHHDDGCFICLSCDRGPIEEPNYHANVQMFAARGITWREIATRMSNFSAPVWMTYGLRSEAHHDDH